LKNKLLFFNTEGYPYNFEYDENKGYYEGDILFDENSNDTFKTVGLYIFEEVPTIHMSTNDLVFKKNEIYNKSGVCFSPGNTQTKHDIINILNVNSNNIFYSKWIYGKNFDTLFPKGSIVSFDSLVFSGTTNDFNNNYYTILENKPNAIMVQTTIRNDIWDNIGTNKFVSGKIYNNNIISYNDYNNTLKNKIENLNLYQDKKLSISGTDYNDGIKSYNNSAVTSTFFQSWGETGNIGDELNLEITLFTERPKLYQGNVNFKLTGSTAYLLFEKGFNSLFNINEGDSIIFEDYYDNPILPTNPIFTIEDGTNEIDLYNGYINFFKTENKIETEINNFNNNTNTIIYDYYFTITGDSSNWGYDLKKGDILYLNHDTYNNTYKNLKRKISIKKIVTFKDITIKKWQEYILNTPILKNTTIKNALNNSVVFEEQLIIDSIELYEKNENNLNSTKYISQPNRVDVFYVNEILIQEQTLNIYSIQKLLKKHEINTVKCSFSPTTTTNIIFDKEVVVYSTSNIINFKSMIINDNNGNIDYKSTIDIFNKKYKNELDKYGLLLLYYDNKFQLISLYQINNNDDLYLETKLYINNLLITQNIVNDKINTIYLDVKNELKYEFINYNEIDKLDKKYYSEIMLDLKDNSNDYGFMLDINDNEYYIKYDDITGGTFTTPTEKTINNFIDKYYDILYKNGILISSGVTTTNVYVDNYKETRINFWSKKILDSYTLLKKTKETALLNDIIFEKQLRIDAVQMYNNNDPKEKIEYLPGQSMLIIEGLYPNVDVYSLSVKVNIFSEYEIINTQDNKSLIISANELQTTDSFFHYEFSTGMIINVHGSRFPINNKQYNIIGLSDNIIELSYQGLFFNDTSNVTIDSQKFIRKPRETYNKDISYSFKFFDDNNEHDDSVFFFYDITGEHLKPPKDINNNYIDSLKYTGPTPLWTIDNECDDVKISLIDKPNENINETTNPMKQQTQFYGNDGDYCLNFKIDTYDSSSQYDFKVEPLQVFIGYNSIKEGTNIGNISMDLINNSQICGITSNSLIFDFNVLENNISVLSVRDNMINFIDVGFEKGMDIYINFIHQTTNVEFSNYNIMTIIDISATNITLYSPYNDTNFTTDNDIYYYELYIINKPILKLKVYGETEIEDIRFKVNLKNLGIELNDDIEHIFKSSDINEDGIDYNLLNKKRKEMLLVYPEIYNYIGSYKAIINAINFFGWNDLELYEYYRNIKHDSELYQKLQKVRIHDIFDNTIDGWTDTDYIKGTYDNGYYKKTNLFNLTFNITNDSGSNILLYSLDEVQIKLKKLKRWLKKHMIPLSSNLVDITGVAKTETDIYYNFNVSNFTTKIHSSNNVSSINFNITSTLNYDKNYLIQLDFYTINNTNPSGWTCKIKTYSSDFDGKLLLQQNIDLLKNDLNSYSFNIQKDVDEYIYVETINYNDYGFGTVNNNLVNYSATKVYRLVNNNFYLPANKKYIPINDYFYFFDSDGYMWIK